MFSKKRQSVTVGEPHERIVTATGLLKAYITDDTKAEEHYVDIFSEFYLEYGLMAIGSSLAVYFQDRENLVELLRQGHFPTDDDPDATLYLTLVEDMLSGKEIFVPTRLGRIKRKKLDALLAVTVALLGVVATAREVTVIDFLEFINQQMLAQNLDQ